MKNGVLLAIMTTAVAAGAQVALKAAVARATGGRMLSLADFQSIISVLWHPGVMGALAVYAMSAIVWIVVLTRVPLSTAYPILGLSFAIVPVLSVILFGERLGGLEVVGLVLVSVGVLMIGIAA